MSSLRDKYGVMDKISECVEAVDVASKDDGFEDLPDSIQDVITKLGPALRGVAHVLIDLEEKHQQLETQVEDMEGY
jgi:DNA repair ATPase RecN